MHTVTHCRSADSKQMRDGPVLRVGRKFPQCYGDFFRHRDTLPEVGVASPQRCFQATTEVLERVLGHSEILDPLHIGVRRHHVLPPGRGSIVHPERARDTTRPVVFAYLEHIQRRKLALHNSTNPTLDSINNLLNLPLLFLGRENAHRHQPSYGETWQSCVLSVGPSFS